MVAIVESTPMDATQTSDCVFERYKHRVGVGTIMRWSKVGVRKNGEMVKLKATQIGGRRLFKVEDLMAFIEAMSA